jgi:hypothetical protein
MMVMCHFVTFSAITTGMCQLASTVPVCWGTNGHKSAGRQKPLWLRHGRSLPSSPDSVLSFAHQFNVVICFFPFFDAYFSFHQA